jgi:hypothetical protein
MTGQWRELRMSNKFCDATFFPNEITGRKLINGTIVVSTLQIRRPENIVTSCPEGRKSGARGDVHY